MIDFAFWPACVRTHEFAKHVSAAAAGGFSSLAVAPETYRRALATGLTPKDMLALAADHGVELRYLDSLTDWAPIRVPREVNPALRERFDMSMDESFEIIDALELKSILAVAGYDLGSVPEDVLIEGFARMCDRAASAGLWVDLEFMPFWGLPDLATAWRIVNGANRPNSGIMVDTWHFSKGNFDLDLLKSIPGERLVSVQIADALKRQRGATLFEDTVRYRMFPGEGELPVVEVLHVLQQKGQLRSVGPEVFSDEADLLSPEESGRRAAVTTLAVLRDAGIGNVRATTSQASR